MRIYTAKRFGRTAKHELTVGGYIDLILERHLEENQEEINGLLRKEIDRLDYAMDLDKRYKHGEFTNQDSSLSAYQHVITKSHMT